MTIQCYCSVHSLHVRQSIITYANLPKLHAAFSQPDHDGKVHQTWLPQYGEQMERRTHQAVVAIAIADPTVHVR